MTIKHKKKSSDRSLDQDPPDGTSVHSPNLVHHASANSAHSQLSCAAVELERRLFAGAGGGSPVWPSPLSVHTDDQLTSQHYGQFQDAGSGSDQGPSGAPAAQPGPASVTSKRRLRVSPHRGRCKQPRQERNSVSPTFHSVVAPGSVAAVAAAAAAAVGSCDAAETVATHSPTLRLESDAAGYNSGDEYGAANAQLTEEQWQEKERLFERKLKKRGLIIKRMVEDGACLFRAVADQLYGDEEMHENVRHFCMNYIATNADYFSQYITEDFTGYVDRKRLAWVHGNHIEIQAISEMYSRPVEVLCYSTDAINIFHGRHEAGAGVPIRLSYHRGTHYNSVVNPYGATIGVGLGLPGLKPGMAELQLMSEATHCSEQLHIEQTMLEDKLRATDWEATDEMLSEQVARESYLQWLKDNEKRNKSSSGCSSSTFTGSRSPRHHGVRSSPPSAAGRAERCSPLASPRQRPSTSFTSATATVTRESQERVDACPDAGPSRDLGFPLLETASFIDQLPPHLLGLSEWEDADVLARVLAKSQQEYLDTLKASSLSEAASGGHTSSEIPVAPSSSATITTDPAQQPSTSRSRSPF